MTDDVRLTTVIGNLSPDEIAQKIIDGWDCEVGDIIIDEDGKQWVGITLIRPANKEDRNDRV